MNQPGLFAEYKRDVHQHLTDNEVTVREEWTVDLIRVTRRCHQNNVPSGVCADVIETIFAPPREWVSASEQEDSEQVALTELGNAAIEETLVLKDAGLGRDTVDESEDDEPAPLL